MGLHSVVIPAKAGIYVFQSLKWTPAPRLRTSRTGFAGVTAVRDIATFKVCFNKKNSTLRILSPIYTHSTRN